MKTAFKSSPHADPRLSEVDRILRRCVHCGLCLPSCPTYTLFQDERDSPRGRIYLMKEMFEQGGTPEPATVRHVSRCLSCLSCTAACPSGVDYMHLVDYARTVIETKVERSPKERLVRTALSKILPSPRRLRFALKLATFARPFARRLKKLGFKEFAAMLELVPRRLPDPARFDGPGTAATRGGRRGRVILLPGCVQQVLRPNITDATIRLLARDGVDVVVPAGVTCCGALDHHLGNERETLARVRRNTDAWSKELSKAPADAIVITAAGCGTMIKDYGYLLKDDLRYAERAARISGLARDVAEYLAAQGLGPAKRWSSLRVAYHPACSLHHGQRLGDEPKQLLLNAGYSVVDIAENHLCCGSAGTYSILQPEIARELLERKCRNIRNAKADIVAAGNIGCISQIALASDTPIVHTVELLDWAHGGPVPPGLESLARYVTDVPKPRRLTSEFVET